MLLLLLLLCWRLTSVWGLAVASPRTGCCLLASYLSRLVVGCNSLTLTAGWRLLEACWLVLLEVQLASRLPLFRAASNASESRCTSFKSSILSHWRMCSFCCRTVMVSYGSSSSRGSRLRCLVPGGEESSQGQTFRSGVCHPGAGARAAEALGPLEAREANRPTTAGILPGASLRLSAKGRLWSGRIATPNWVRTSLTWRIKPSPFGRVSRGSRTAKPSRPASVRRAAAL